jgi:hypothetical protein
MPLMRRISAHNDRADPSMSGSFATKSWREGIVPLL